MSVRKARKLRDILLVAGTVIMLCSLFYEPLLKIGAVVAFSCIIPHFLYNRCPHCGRQLGKGEGKYCRHCGKRLDA